MADEPSPKVIGSTTMATPTFGPPILISQGPDHALGSWGDHIIGVWDGALAVNSVKTWRAHVQTRVKANPGKTVYVSYERAGFRMPSDAVRDVVIDTFRSTDGALAACAVILPTSGFASAAVRALVSGLVLASRMKTPLQCLATIADTHTWVERVAPQASWPSAADLRAAIGSLEESVRGSQVTRRAV